MDNVQNCDSYTKHVSSSKTTIPITKCNLYYNRTAHKLDITYSFHCSFTHRTLPLNPAIFIEVPYSLTYIPSPHSLTHHTLIYFHTHRSVHSLAHSFTH
jgi:hypothetical protein